MPTATARSPGARCAPDTATSPPTRWRGWRSNRRRRGVPRRRRVASRSTNTPTAPTRCCRPAHRLPTGADPRWCCATALFADLDPQHRGLLQLVSAAGSRTAILGPQAPTQRFELQQPSRLAQFLDYVARRRLAHLDRLRPHPVPAVAAAACGAVAPGRRLAGGGAFPRRPSSTLPRSSPPSPSRTRSRCRWRRSAWSRCRRAGSSRRSPRRSCWPR